MAYCLFKLILVAPACFGQRQIFNGPGPCPRTCLKSRNGYDLIVTGRP